MKHATRFLILTFAALVVPTMSRAETTTSSAAKPTAAQPATPGTMATKPAAPAKPAADLMDINTATEEQLAELPGVGEVIAKKIVAGRPYANRTQLLSRHVVTKGTYDKIRSLVTAKNANPTMASKTSSGGTTMKHHTTKAKPAAAATAPPK